MKSNYRRILFFTPIMLLAVIMLPSSKWWSYQGAEVEAQSPTKQATPKQAADQPSAKQAFLTVSTSDIENSIVVTGELRAEKSRELTLPRIRSAMASVVTYLALEGTQVKKGEVILAFDASALLSQKSEAERRLDEAKLTIEKTKSDLESQRADLLAALSTAEGNLKVAQLYAKISKDLLPANTFQKYQLDLQKAELARQKAQERLKNLEASVPAQMALVEVSKSQAEIELKKIESDVNLLSVEAPQDGIVIYGDNMLANRKIQIGDNLFPGMPVITLPDLSTMQVVGFVYDTEFRFLAPGMVCELSLDAIPGRTWRGKIQSLTSVASKKGFASQHKVFRAVIQLDSIDLAVMKPGMTVRAEIPLNRASKAISVPREYLGVDTKGRYYVLKGSDPRTLSVQVVSIGAFSDRKVQITSGLAVGDHIMEIKQRGGAKL